jgi:hypothetical protein
MGDADAGVLLSERATIRARPRPLQAPPHHRWPGRARRARPPTRRRRRRRRTRRCSRSAMCVVTPSARSTAAPSPAGCEGLPSRHGHPRGREDREKGMGEEKSPRSADGGTGRRLRRRRAGAACGVLAVGECAVHAYMSCRILNYAYIFGASLRLEDLFNQAAPYTWRRLWAQAVNTALPQLAQSPRRPASAQRLSTRSAPLIESKTLSQTLYCLHTHGPPRSRHHRARSPRLGRAGRPGGRRELEGSYRDREEAMRDSQGANSLLGAVHALDMPCRR